MSIAQCLVAWVDNNSMNLPIKLLSEKQKGIEIQYFTLPHLLRTDSE